MATIIFEDFCKLAYSSSNYNNIDVIVEIVSRNMDGVGGHCVLIRRLEDEDTVIGEFPVNKGLIERIDVPHGQGKQFYSVELNYSLLENTTLRENEFGDFVLPGAGSYQVISRFVINFFSHPSQKKFLSEIRRIQKM